MVGSGTTELIRLIALAYFGQEDSILILEPTYGEYEIAGRLVGARLVKQWTGVEENFTPRLEETISLIKEHRPRGVFICNPNNPTGQYLSRPGVEGVLENIGDGLLILDEAYIAFVKESWPSLDLVDRGNVVILRSMTKDYGLAGLRLGYALAGQEIIDCLRRVCPPWNVNVIAQQIGALVLEDEDYLEQTKTRISEAKQFLVDGLTELGFPPLPSAANFFLVKVGNAQVFRTALLKRGLLVRDGTSFGLPEYVRIGVRTLPECQQLLDTIKMVRDEGEIDDGF